MEDYKKVKLKVKDEFLKELYETYPNAFEIKEKTIKIKQLETFTKLMTLHINKKKQIVEELGVVYYGYFSLLVDTMSYSSKVDFNDLLLLWIKPWMIKVFRKKWLDFWLFKKIDKSFYVNPIYALKWDTINPLLIEHFK